MFPLPTQNFSADTICEQLRQAGVSPADMIRVNDPRRRPIEVLNVFFICSAEKLLHLPIAAYTLVMNCMLSSWLDRYCHCRGIAAVSTNGSVMAAVHVTVLLCVLHVPLQAIPTTFEYTAFDAGLRAFTLPSPATLAMKKVCYIPIKCHMAGCLCGGTGLHCGLGD